MKKSSGGLVSAMLGIRGLDMLWIGWPGTEVPVRVFPLICFNLAFGSLFFPFLHIGRRPRRSSRPFEGAGLRSGLSVTEDH